jgi:hypothetical protein
MAKMIGKTPVGKSGVICKCCVPPSWRLVNKRAAKRRERNNWKKEI